MFLLPSLPSPQKDPFKRIAPHLPRTVSSPPPLRIFLLLLVGWGEPFCVFDTEFQSNKKVKMRLLRSTWMCVNVLFRRWTMVKEKGYDEGYIRRIHIYIILYKITKWEKWMEWKSQRERERERSFKTSIIRRVRSFEGTTILLLSPSLPPFLSNSRFRPVETNRNRPIFLQTPTLIS